MKVAFAENNVKGSAGLKSTTGFKINAGAHAFKLLSSGLYSNKIGSILREIGCNAVDAHIAYGTPNLPIELKLPNRIDPQFHIKDWGPGLSHEDITGLYSTYFASTKQNTNTQTGAFGLGSKSPFSYTDSFMVTSVHGGVKRIYSCYLDNTGSPTTSLMAETEADTDWPHGLMVGFNVEPKDFGYFQEQARVQFELFSVIPKVLGGEPIVRPILLNETPEYATWDRNEHIVLMGNVKYPLKPEAFLRNGDDALYSIMNAGAHYVFKVPIEYVHPVVSREQLDYDPYTVANLKKLVLIVGKHIAEKVVDQIKAAEKGTWADRCALPQLIEQTFQQTYALQNLFNATGYPNAEALYQKCTEKQAEFPATTGVFAECRLLTVDPYRAKPALRTSIIRAGNNVSGGYTTKGHYKLIPETLVIYGVEKHSFPRIKQLLLDGKAKQVIYFFSKTSAKEAEKEAKDFATFAGGIPVKELKEYDPPPTIVAAKAARQYVRKLKTNVVPHIEVDVVTGGIAKKQFLDTLTVDQKFFVIKAVNSNWRRPAVRIIRPNKADLFLTEKNWNSTFAIHNHLRKVMGLPQQSYVYITKPDFDMLRLEKFGWKCMHEEIQNWAVHSDTLKCVETAMKQYYPPIAIIQPSKWDSPWPILRGMVYLKHGETKQDKHLYNIAKPILEKHNLLDLVEGIYQASIKPSGNTAVEIVTYYLSLVKQINAKYPESLSGKTGIHELEAHLLSERPGLKAITYTLINDCPEKMLPIVLDTLLTKET